MKTLREVACGQTVTVKRLHGRGTGQETYHGHGHHKGCSGLCKKGCSAWRSCRGQQSAAMSCP